ncbi:MAG: hypothetical protein LBB88_08110 [Planctomycetaceae bacterium]|nr:hypothetical protein [Planctomycetaceae bacterium]
MNGYESFSLVRELLPKILQNNFNFYLRRYISQNIHFFSWLSIKKQRLKTGNRIAGENFFNRYTLLALRKFGNLKERLCLTSIS